MRGVLKGASRSLSVPKAPFEASAMSRTTARIRPPFSTPGLRRPAETTLPTPCGIGWGLPTQPPVLALIKKRSWRRDVAVGPRTKVGGREFPLAEDDP